MCRTIVLSLLFVFILATGALADSVKLAVFPSNDPAKLQVAMDIMADYLSQQTGDEVMAVVTRDYKELADRLRDQSVDIAWLNTLNYVRIKAEISDIQYLATYMEKNENTGEIMPFYQSYILALKQSGLSTVQELEHRRFAFTDRGSTSGYAYPNLLLRKQGIIPGDFFKKVFFLKKHDRVIEALLKGSIDAGAVSDGTYFTAVRNYGDQFTILAKSDPIPLDAIVAVKKMKATKVAAYRKALTAMNPDHAFCKKMREVLGWSAAGFETRSDAFYDTTREALKQ